MFVFSWTTLCINSLFPKVKQIDTNVWIFQHKTHTNTCKHIDIQRVKECNYFKPILGKQWYKSLSPLFFQYIDFVLRNFSYYQNLISIHSCFYVSYDTYKQNNNCFSMVSKNTHRHRETTSLQQESMKSLLYQTDGNTFSILEYLAFYSLSP